MNHPVKVNFYRYSGYGKADLPDALKNATRDGTTFETLGNLYSIKEIESRVGGLLVGRIRRLQESDIPDIGSRDGTDVPFDDGTGLSHRAYFLVDPDKEMLLWLSSHNSCGPNWLAKIAGRQGCKISLAVYLEQDVFEKARSNKEATTSVKIAIATDVGQGLGLPITDDLLEKAQELSADIVELEIKVHHHRANQSLLSNAWSIVEKLHEMIPRRKGAVRKLQVEQFDEATGEFIGRNLLKSRSEVELLSPFTVQQLPARVAYELLSEAHNQMFGDKP